MTNAGASSAAEGDAGEGEVSASSRRSEGDLRVSIEVDEEGGGGGGESTEELVLMSAVEDPIARWATVEKGLRRGEATRFEEKLS